MSRDSSTASERRATGPERGAVVALPARVDDAELVARARSGDRWAGEALYRRHAPDVIRVAMLLLGRTADVDDVVQDAFVKALRKLETLRDPASFGAWVARIAANLSRSRLRRRALFRRLGLDRGDEEVGLDQLAVDGVSAEDRAELARISVALRELSADVRIAWTLRRVEGWPLADVGEAVGASLATVKRRVAAADEVLRAHVAGVIAGEEEER